jgi:hypothetical protein
MRSTVIAWFVVSALSGAGCAHHAPNGDNMTQGELAIQVLKDPAATASSVLSAIGQVAASEPASLWTGVANDARFPAFHRSVAAWQLLKRYVPQGMSIDDAAKMLGGAAWLDTATLEKITTLGGEIPVRIPEHGAAFILRLPRGSASELPDLGAYLAVDRNADAATLRAALAAQAAGASLAGAHLTGVATFPEDLGRGH